MDHDGMTLTEWRELMDAMEEVGPYYDRVNSLITLGMVDRWRRRAASVARPEDVVLEIGSGPGNFTRHLKAGTVIALEPSSELSASATKLLGGDKVGFLRGVGERIPLADRTVDKVFCVFSFRDFFDRKAGIGEMRRVLKDGGEAIIVDMAKPPPGPMAKMIDFHVRHMVPPLARIAAPAAAKERWARDPYTKLLETYEAYGTVDFCEKSLRDGGFVDVATEYLELRGATMTRGKKPWKSTS